MALCLVSGTIKDASATAISGAQIAFSLQNPTLIAEPYDISTTSASDGTWSMNLVQGQSGIITVRSIISPNMGKRETFAFGVNIPATPTATFASILGDV